MSHPKCTEGHVCQEPSGRECYQQCCAEPAGTWWGPLWCPEHDQERLERISRGLRDLERAFGLPSNGGAA